MVFFKNIKFYLAISLFLVGCKSTDCGCPMASNAKSAKDGQQKITASKQLYWKQLSEKETAYKLISLEAQAK